MSLKRLKSNWQIFYNIMDLSKINGKMVILSAPSGAGKTTLVRSLLEHHELKLSFSISATSRMQRPGEIDGKDYYFMTPEEFRKKITDKAFIEYEEVYPGKFYGTLQSEIERIWQSSRNVVFDIDVQGAMSLKRIFTNRALAIFVEPPSIDVLRERLSGRGTENIYSLKQRLDKALLEMSFRDHFDLVIVNDNLEKSIHETYQAVSRFLTK